MFCLPLVTCFISLSGSLYRPRNQPSNLLSCPNSPSSLFHLWLWTSGCFTPTHLKCLSAVQDFDESFAKLDVERGVDDGVDSAVEVSQPGDGAVQWWGDTAAPAVGLQHVSQEERQPADDENTFETRTGCWLLIKPYCQIQYFNY